MYDWRLNWLFAIMFVVFVFNQTVGMVGLIIVNTMDQIIEHIKCIPYRMEADEDV